MANIVGLPQNHRRYVVARLFEGNYWYWGSWNEREHAADVASRLDGAVIAEIEQPSKEVDKNG